MFQQRVISFLTVILLLALSAWAGVPQLINFQGQLKNNSGSPLVNDTLAVEFKIYDAVTAGNVKWSEIDTVITDANGLFTILLGKKTPIPDSVFNDSLRWLGIKVGSDAEISPRSQLSSVGYSYVSSQWTSTGQDLFRLDGNVGIGTASPGAKLDVKTSGSIGVSGYSSSGWGVYGSGYNYGVLGDASSGAGVRGVGPMGVEGVGVNYGVYGTSTSGTGVYGTSTNSYGVYASSTNGYGLYAVGGPNGVVASAGSGAGVSATSASGPGVVASGGTNGVEATGGSRGVYATGTNYGVVGFNTSGTGIYGSGLFGVYGVATQGFQGYGVYGSDGDISGTWAGAFHGGVYVSEILVVDGFIYKNGGGFRIDHPLDPANKYLYHSFVESPDMKNIYDGVVTTDADGNASVTLPEWFGALNKDFRYQLTVIGQFAQAIVSKEIANNQFSIKTDKPNVKVSWQVTGIRKDPYAEAHRIPVEEAKTGKEQGKYLHPEVYGAPVSLGMHYEETQKQAAEHKKMQEQQVKMEQERKLHEEQQVKMEQEHKNLEEQRIKMEQESSPPKR